MKLLRTLIVEQWLLLEYDRDKTVKMHGKKVLQSLKDAPGATFGMTHPVEVAAHKYLQGGNPELATNVLMSHFEALDSSPTKKHVPHIARIYANGGVERFEDMGRVAQALHQHHELSNRKIIPPEHRDAGKFKTLSALEDVVDAHADKLSGKQEDALHHEKMKQEATITDHPDFTHIIPHTKEAAQHFGKGTRWCTSSTRNNMFNHYNEAAQLHIYIPKKPSYDGEKYQFAAADGEHDAAHIADRIKDYELTGGRNHGKLISSVLMRSQIMDEKDVNAKSSLFEKHPEIITHMSNHIVDSINSMSKDHPEPWVRYAHHVNSREPDVDSMYNDKSNMIRKMSFHHMDKNDGRLYDFVKKHVDAYDYEERPYTVDHFDYDDHHSVDVSSLMNHKNPGAYKAVVDHIKETNTHDRIQSVAASPHIKQDMIDRVIERANSDDPHMGFAIHDGPNTLAYAAHALAQNPKVMTRLDDIKKIIDKHHTKQEKREGGFSRELDHNYEKSAQMLYDKKKALEQKQTHSTIRSQIHWHSKPDGS